MFSLLNYLYFVLVVLPSVALADSQYWTQADKCQFQNGTEGRCILFEKCPKDRALEYMPSCGSGDFPDVCCESQPEDFLENPFGRIARKKCQKYMDDLFKWQNYGLVFGGKNAQPKEYTFMAALGYGPDTKNIKFQCGGSLISERHVLTAAHCLFSLDDGPVKYVLVGDLDLNSTDDEAQPQYLYVKNVSVHPEYKRSSVYHDLAVLELDRPVNFTEFVKPACLDFGQHENKFNFTSFYATGWGIVDTNGNRLSHLQEVQLVELDLDHCIKFYPATGRKLKKGLQHTQMCATGAIEKKDTCQGDSGGPLSRHNDDIRYSRYKGYVIAGITSFGKLCGYTSAPGVYTRVRSYIPWIESVVWPEEVIKEPEGDRISPVVLPQSGASGIPVPPSTTEAVQQSTTELPPSSTYFNLLIEPAREIIYQKPQNFLITANPQNSVPTETPPHTNVPPNAPRPIYVVVDNPENRPVAEILASFSTIKLETSTTTVTLTTKKKINLVDFHIFTDRK